MDLLVFTESLELEFESNCVSYMNQGEDASIEAAVVAIGHCLREPIGPNNCSEVK